MTAATVAAKHRWTLVDKVDRDGDPYVAGGCACGADIGEDGGDGIEHSAHLAEAVEAAVRDDIKAKALNVLAEHTIECTGLGEVSCRGCRESGWMSWSTYREHVAELIARGPS